MSDKYKIFKGNEACFVTFTVIDWIKVLEDENADKPSLISLLLLSL
jgi:hypothetical protein